MKLFKREGTKEWTATRDLILAFHNKAPMEEVSALNKELQKHNAKRNINLVTAALRLALDYNHGGEDGARFEKNWFIRLDQRVVEKNQNYDCSWVFVSACILAVISAPEVAEHIPRNIASFYSAMIIEELIEDSLRPGETFDQLLVQILTWAEKFVEDL